MDLENRVAIISGATGGLGRVVTRQFAIARARLLLVSSNAEKLQAVGEELSIPSEQWGFLAADLSKPQAAGKVLDTAINRFGRADILLHLVGGWMGGKPVSQTDEADVRLMLEQHLWPAYYLAKALVPHFISKGWGRMVAISSPTAGNPPANSAPYAIGKAALETLFLTLAEELKGSGVTANIIRVKTIDVNHERDRERTNKNATWTTPEEIGAATLFLCSQEAQMVNGARIPVYGSS